MVRFCYLPRLLAGVRFYFPGSPSSPWWLVLDEVVVVVSLLEATLLAITVVELEAAALALAELELELELATETLACASPAAALAAAA